MKAWRQPSPCRVEGEFVEAVGSQPLAELLYRRGVRTPQAAISYLTGGVDVDESGLPDLNAGVEAVAQAVAAGRTICVYGDYDTDGVTSTALLVGLLQQVGARVMYHVPNRFKEGYGMNGHIVEGLLAKDVGLILTCDCGIRNVEEVAAAQRLGMQVVVTDHHELGPVLPGAEAVINAKRLRPDHPCYMLPGVGTAYLFARALLQRLDRSPAEADRWLDLVAVGIIADVVPLTGANRELARRGLSRINTSPCTGLQALLQVAELVGHVTEEEIAFQVVPRLNAAGRLADAALGVRLLLAQDRDQARSLAGELDQLNQDRKKLTATVVEGAADQAQEGAQAILLYRPDWHEGVLGIAAGKLAEEYGVPTLLLSRKHGTKILVGSARAPEGFPLHEALDACGEHLLKHGGHAAAAGFSLLEDHFPAFRAAMLEEVRRRSGRHVPETVVAADISLPLKLVDRALYDQLRRAGPFGEANPPPVLFSPGVKVLSARPIGTDEQHLRLVLRDGEQAFTGLWWGAGDMKLGPQETDLYYRIALNRWHGQEMLQVIVEHVGPGLPPVPLAELEPELPPPLEPAAPDLEEWPVTAEATPQYSPERRPIKLPRPELFDRRDQDPIDVSLDYPGALLVAEGGAQHSGLGTVDRYSLRAAPVLVLLSPPPSPRLLEEYRAMTGAEQLVFAWPTKPEPAEERFLPTLMLHLADILSGSRYISVGRLAVQMGELEPAVRYGLQALARSELIAIDEEDGDRVRVRRREDGRGINESPALEQMRRLVAESRAFRRFLRTGSLAAIEKAIF